MNMIISNLVLLKQHHRQNNKPWKFCCRRMFLFSSHLCISVYLNGILVIGQRCHYDLCITKISPYRIYFVIAIMFIPYNVHVIVTNMPFLFGIKEDNSDLISTHIRFFFYIISFLTLFV